MIVRALIKNRTESPRVPVLKNPSDYGMAFQNVDIKSSDGIRLSAWLIERPSNKLIIVNHPLMTNRYGTERGMDDVPVNFMPMLKALYEANYNILTYDHRGQGESDGNLGANQRGPTPCIVGVGTTEWQDLVGVLNHVKNDNRLSSMQVGLHMQCMGANAALRAFDLAPEAFKGLDLRCMVASQPPISGNMVARATFMKTGVDLSADVEKILTEEFKAPGVSALNHVGKVTLPCLFLQVKADVYTNGGLIPGIDTEKIYEACPTEKKLLMVGPGTDKPYGTGKRFEGYCYFSDHPEDLLDWFAKYIK